METKMGPREAIDTFRAVAGIFSLMSLMQGDCPADIKMLTTKLQEAIRVAEIYMDDALSIEAKEDGNEND